MATYSKGTRSFDTERGGYLRLIVRSTSLFPYLFYPHVQSCSESMSSIPILAPYLAATGASYAEQN